MSRDQMDQVLKIYRDSPLDLGGDPAEQRENFRQMVASTPVPADVRAAPFDLGGVPTVRVSIAGTERVATILYFHGGGYAIGSAETSVGLAAEVARRAGAEVISVDYRLAPEHRYPAATDDALTVYRGLLSGGTSPASLVIMGESAGGGLAIATLLSARAAGLALPAAAVVFSPWVDLTQSGASMATKADVDPVLNAQKLQIRADDYLLGSGTEPRADLVSPVFADLSGLPPLLIQVGTSEVLLDDATRLAAKAAADDVDVVLDDIPFAPHVSQAFAPILDESASALDRMAAFVRDHVRQAAPARPLPTSGSQRGPTPTSYGRGQQTWPTRSP